MSEWNRRSVLSALGAALPFGLGTRLGAATPAPAPGLRLRPFEDAVRAAFRSADPGPAGVATVGGAVVPCRRVEVGHSSDVTAGVQGCHTDRPFAGFPAGHLRIVRAGAGPGPARGGVRLYVGTVDVAVTGGRADGGPSRPLDFATLPPAATFSEEPSASDAARSPARPAATRA